MSIFDFFNRKKKSLYSGGDGSSMEKAVIINAKSTMDGVPAEYDYISQKHGVRDEDWILVSQSLKKNSDGKAFDVINIELTEGTSFSYFFDISEFFGKF